jgi:hypothetical protein
VKGLRLYVSCCSLFYTIIHLHCKYLAFQVSDGFLIKTYDTAVTIPSRGPGPVPLPTDEFAVIPLVSDEDTELSVTRQLTSVYLVEPRRVSSAVLKFSGTLGMRNGQDKRSATIMAFSHFVLEDSACRYMFADIQGKYYILP